MQSELVPDPMLVTVQKTDGQPHPPFPVFLRYLLAQRLGLYDIVIYLANNKPILYTDNKRALAVSSIHGSMKEIAKALWRFAKNPPFIHLSPPHSVPRRARAHAHAQCCIQPQGAEALSSELLD